MPSSGAGFLVGLRSLNKLDSKETGKAFNHRSIIYSWDIIVGTVKSDLKNEENCVGGGAIYTNGAQ